MTDDQWTSASKDLLIAEIHRLQGERNDLARRAAPEAVAPGLEPVTDADQLSYALELLDYLRGYPDFDCLTLEDGTVNVVRESIEQVFNRERPAMLVSMGYLSQGLMPPRDAAPTDSQAGRDAVEAARYRLLRRGQHWSVIDYAGNALRAEALDEAVDRRLSTTAGRAE